MASPWDGKIPFHLKNFSEVHREPVRDLLAVAAVVAARVEVFSVAVVETRAEEFPTRAWALVEPVLVRITDRIGATREHTRVEVLPDGENRLVTSKTVDFCHFLDTQKAVESALLFARISSRTRSLALRPVT